MIALIMDLIHIAISFMTQQYLLNFCGYLDDLKEIFLKMS